MWIKLCLALMIFSLEARAELELTTIYRFDRSMGNTPSQQVKDTQGRVHSFDCAKQMVNIPWLGNSNPIRFASNGDCLDAKYFIRAGSKNSTIEVEVGRGRIVRLSEIRF